jgi:hypothetical protein
MATVANRAVAAVLTDASTMHLHVLGVEHS